MESTSKEPRMTASLKQGGSEEHATPENGAVPIDERDASKLRTDLAQKFAELYELAQEHYRMLLDAIRDDGVGIRDFDARAYVHYRQMARLKEMKRRLNALRSEADR